MKNIITLALCLLSFTMIFGQSGTVLYSEQRELKIQMDHQHEDIAAMLPNFNKFKKLLTFSSSQSSFKDVSDENEFSFDNETSDGPVKIQMKMKAPQDQYYKNLDESVSIDKKELFGKNFIIEKPIEEVKWKMLNEQKQILDYTCMKASYTQDTVTTIAWFTPQIPISNGPQKWGGLPGMILELSTDNGALTYKALKVNMTEEIDLIEKPKDGKKVSQEEYDKIREKKMKEMEEMYGAKRGSGGMIIIKN